MERFITGNKFKALSDFVYAPPIKDSDDYENIVNTLEIGLLEDYDIIYTPTFYAKQLFKVIEQVDKKLYIITHNGDNVVDDSYLIPDNIIKWYAVMVNVINPRIESIPIGLANDFWFPWLNKKQIMLDKLQYERNYRNLVYMNFDVRTNIPKRQPLYELMKDKPWVTTRMGVNTVAFDDYIDNIYNHKFVLCPDGNGLGSHRTWESLYMGSIPIEKINISNQFYTDLPILFVNDWDEITEDFLNEKWATMSNAQWNTGKINLSYWKHKITGRW